MHLINLEPRLKMCFEGAKGRFIQSAFKWGWFHLLIKIKVWIMGFVQKFQHSNFEVDTRAGVEKVVQHQQSIFKA